MIELRDQVRMDNILMFKNDNPKDPCYIKVYEISLFNCGYGEIEFPAPGEVRWERLCGVPLTEELLLQCGLLEAGIFKDNEYYAIDNSFSLRYEGSYAVVDLKYLHELQNIYQDVCYEKLKVKI